MNKNTILGRGAEIVQFVLGGAILLFFGLATFGTFLGGEDIGSAGFWFLIVMDAVGAALIFFGCRRHMLLSVYNQYSELLDQRAQYSVSEIASMTNTEEKAVKANLDKMIRRQYFEDAHWDGAGQYIVFPDRMQQEAPVEEPYEPAGQESMALQDSAETVSVICQSCGGFNKVEKGKTGECEFCGSTIKGE